MTDTLEIPLSRGHVALIDAADAWVLDGPKWFAMRVTENHVYARRKIPVTAAGGKPYQLLHRLLLDAPPRAHVDHINGNGLDNRRVNMRLCTHAQNMRNRRPSKGGLSQYKGVWKSGSRWRARANINNKRINLGSFATEIEAAVAYDEHARRAYGEFAHLNFPENHGRVFLPGKGPSTAVNTVEGG